MNLLDALIEDGLELPPILVGSEQRREVWICIRSDNVQGDGTKQNPYNGSTASLFDTLMNDTGKIGPNMTIRLEPGIYQTQGGAGTSHVSTGWLPQNGQRIVGAGVHCTTLQLIGAGGVFNQSIPIVGKNAAVSNFEISDLTLDCNMHRQLTSSGQLADVMVQAVQIAGKNNLVRRVRVVNFGVFSCLECFPIFLTPKQTGDPPANEKERGNTVIDEVIVEYPHQSNGRECTVLSAYGDVLGAPSAIHDCYVNTEFANPQYPEIEVIEKIVDGSKVTIRTKFPHCLQKFDIIVITGTMANNDAAWGKRFKLDATAWSGTVLDEWQIELEPASVSGTVTGIRLIGVFDPAGPTGGKNLLFLPSLEIESLTSVASGSEYVVTVQTAVAHERLSGDWIRVSGVSNASSTFNGAFQVTNVPSGTSLEYKVKVNPGASASGEIYLDRVKTPFARGGNFSYNSSDFTITLNTVGAQYQRVGDRLRIQGVSINNKEHSIYAQVIEVMPPQTFGGFWFMKVKLSAALPAGTITSPGLQLGASFQGIGNGSGTVATPNGTSDEACRNRIYNCPIGGPYEDTHFAGSIWVYENYYYNVFHGPYKNLNTGVKFDRFTVEENIIQTRPHVPGEIDNHPAGIAVSGKFGAAALEVVAKGNIWRVIDGITDPIDGSVCVRIYYVDNVVVRDNVGPLLNNPSGNASYFPFCVTSADAISAFNNQTPNGQMVNVMDLVPSSLAQGSRVMEIADDIDDFWVLV